MKDEIILRSDLMKMRFIADKFSHLFVSSSPGVESKTFSPRRCQIISDRFKIYCALKSIFYSFLSFLDRDTR